MPAALEDAMLPALEDLVPMPAPRTTPAGAALLDAASSLFAQRGITATGVDLITQHAGITKRTLYQRFGAKEALVAACLAQRAHDWQARLLAELDAAPAVPPDLAVRLVFTAAREWTRDPRRGCTFLGAWAEVSALPGEAAQVVQAEKAWMRRMFVALAGDARRGELVHQLYEGAQMCAAIGGDPEGLDRAAEVAARIADGRAAGRGASPIDG